MPFQLLHSLPQELLTEVVRFAAITPGGGLPSVAINLPLCDKALYSRVALCSSSLKELKGNSDIIHPSWYTHAGLWSAVYKDIFSSSAVTRRSFTPDVQGYASQLVTYCNVLRYLRKSQQAGYRNLDDVRADNIFETMSLMLLECDGKNTCQLESAGAYDYCMQWLHQKLYLPDQDFAVNQWPRDDACVAFALLSTWQLTTAERLQAEDEATAVRFQDMLFRFCYCTWMYPTAHAPIHHFQLPLAPSDGQPFALRNVQQSLGRTTRFPLYRSYTSPLPRLNTDNCQVPYYGGTMDWSPPLISTAAKKLLMARRELYPFGGAPNLAGSREELLQRRRTEFDELTAESPALLALYNLCQVHGRLIVEDMITRHTLPPNIMVMDGLQEAILTLPSIFGINGHQPHRATGVTRPAISEWNSRRETRLPFRGGWDEDGDDPNNRNWGKTGRSSTSLPPQVRGLASIGLPYSCKNLSEIHDTHFWRLRLCASPTDPLSLSMFMSRDDSHSLQKASLIGPLARLSPGRTWRPGLLTGLFQGRMALPNEHWLLNNYHADTFTTLPLGADFERRLWTPHLQFYGRFKEHHLQPKRRNPSSSRTSREATASDESHASPVPPTFNARTFPKAVIPPGQPAPRPEVFASVITPGEEVYIDEGAGNAFLPEGFRWDEQTDRDGVTTSTFAWGPPGHPHPDRTVEYEACVPGQPSSHDPLVCPRCMEEKEYLAGLERMRREEERAKEARVRRVRDAFAEGLFESVGMGRESTEPMNVDEDNMDVDEEDDDDDSSEDVDSLDDELAGMVTQSPAHFHRCDGVEDIVITGETDERHGQAYNHFQFLGRVRPWDGLVCIIRMPKDFEAAFSTQLFYGYFESDLNVVGTWRLILGDRLGAMGGRGFQQQPLYLPRGGVNGAGLLGRGGSGVLGDGMRVIWEGPWTMSKVVEE